MIISQYIGIQYKPVDSNEYGRTFNIGIQYKPVSIEYGRMLISTDRTTHSLMITDLSKTSCLTMASLPLPGSDNGTYTEVLSYQARRGLVISSGKIQVRNNRWFYR